MVVYNVDDLEAQERKHSSGIAVGHGGMRNKWLDYENNRFVKEAEEHRSGYFLEHHVEVLGSALAEYLDFDVVHQEPCILVRNDETSRPGVYSPNFLQPNEKEYTMLELLDDFSVKAEDFICLTDFEKVDTVILCLSDKVGEERAESYLSKMCLMDYLLGNTDRHTKNYGLIENSTTLSAITWRELPLFDFGQGLLSTNFMITESTDYSEYQKYMRVGPSAVPLDFMKERFGDGWRALLKQLGINKFPRSILQHIKPQGVLYFINACNSIGVDVK